MGMGMGGGRWRRNAEPVKVENPWQSFLRVVPWLLPYWPVLLFGFGCMIVTKFLQLQPPQVMRWAFDDVIAKGQYALVGRVVLYLALLYVFAAVVNSLRTYFLHVAGQKLLHNLRTRLYEHYQKLSLTYYDNRQTGDIMSRLTGDVQEIEQLMVHGLDAILMDLFGMLLAFWYIWKIHPSLAFVVLIPVPLLSAGLYTISRIVRRIYRQIREHMGQLNAKLQENLSGIRVVKAFGREETEQGLVTNQSRLVLDWNVRGFRTWPFFGAATGLISNFGQVAALGLGIYLAIKGEVTVGALIAVSSYVGNFYQPIGSINQFFDSIQRSLAAADRLFEVLDTKPEVEDPEQPRPLPKVEGHVEFRDVSFRYATGEIVLRGVSVTADPGQRIALVGRSGAGKSSFINLIPRFYDTLEGAVLVDGVNVRDITQRDLRRHIALVLQETFLFNGTVRDNLRYGRLEATDAEIEEAAMAANAHEFIVRLENGYDTEIGERGVKLSGGQRQRLAIARAILADPRILILDEATSSVDSESEFLIHQALERLMAGRTTFVIAHRLSTIRNADAILVLENGEIVERGTHQDLVKADGRYAQMYRQQFWLDDLFAEEEEAEQLRPRGRYAAATPDADLPAMS